MLNGITFDLKYIYIYIYIYICFPLHIKIGINIFYTQFFLIYYLFILSSFLSLQIPLTQLIFY
jgi:hypothetical protein